VTLLQWIDSRDGTPVPALSQRIIELAAPFSESAGDEAQRCLDAAVAGLRRVLLRTDKSRDGALDLLAVDALVTYAFEAASEGGDRTAQLARDALVRLSNTKSSLTTPA
jgi:hypothetical protein